MTCYWYFYLNSHQWQQMKLTKQCTRWSLRLVLILHPLAMEDFRRVFVHQLMSACVMEYLILASYRSGVCLLLLLLHAYVSSLMNSLVQDGDIINIDVTVYLNVCSCFIIFILILVHSYLCHLNPYWLKINLIFSSYLLITNLYQSTYVIRLIYVLVVSVNYLQYSAYKWC